jgi:hypothetical protein
VPSVPKVWVKYGNNHPALIDTQGIQFLAEFTDKVRANPQVGVPSTGVILLYKGNINHNLQIKRK